MEQFLNLILPFFLVILIGYIVGKKNWMPQEALPVLTRFVMLFLLPAWLFHTLPKTPFEEIANFSFVGLYTLGSVSVFFIAFLIFRFVHKRDQLNSAFFAEACTMPNTGYLGIPMIAGILGPAAVVPVTLALIIELLVIAPLTIVVGNQSADESTSKLLLTMGKSLATNSLIISVFLAILASFFQLKVPGFIDNTLALMAKGAGAAALFAIGLALSQRRLRDTSGEVWTMSLTKLFVHPLVIFILMFLIFPQDPLFATAAVLAASLPIAVNAYLLGQKGGADVQPISTAILVSSAIAVASFTAILAYLQ